MSTEVYLWPPVSAVGAMWTTRSPVSVSKSTFDGPQYVSEFGRTRRHAQRVVSGIGSDHSAAGYIEGLKGRLRGNAEGCANLVRLRSHAINWGDAPIPESERNGVLLNWTSGGVDLNWTFGATELLWYSGNVYGGTTTTSQGVPAVTVTGLPANTVICKPGEFLTIYEDSADVSGASSMILAPATSNGSGVATIRLVSELPYDGRVSFSESETAVFRPDGLPEQVRTVGENWFYDWSFTEVFADEVGGFTEINPW